MPTFVAVAMQICIYDNVKCSLTWYLTKLHKFCTNISTLHSVQTGCQLFQLKINRNAFLHWKFTVVAIKFQADCVCFAMQNWAPKTMQQIMCQTTNAANAARIDCNKNLRQFKKTAQFEAGCRLSCFYYYYYCKPETALHTFWRCITYYGVILCK